MSKQNYYPTISQIYDYGVGVRGKREEHHFTNYIPPINSEDIKKHNIEETKLMERFELPVKSINFDNLQNLTNPEVCGQHYWFVFHISSVNYPINPSELYKERMKNFILSIPILLPCLKCKYDATAYIDSRKKELNTIVLNRENLFNFFVDFHNMVNEKHGKRKYSYEEIKKIYNYI